MDSLKRTVAGAAALVALGAWSGAHAGVIIDLFDNDPYQEIIATGIVGGVNALKSTQNGSAYPATSTIGRYRDLSIEKTKGSLSAALRAGLIDDTGKLSISNDDGVASTSVVTWDGSNVAGNRGTNINVTGLNGEDLTVGDANQFLANVIRADLGFKYTIKVWDMDGDYSFLSAAVQFQVIESNNAQAHYFFDWFNLNPGTYCDGIASPPNCANPATQLDFSIARGKTNLGADGIVDFANIGALQLVLYTDPNNPQTLSADFALGTVKTVPEPGALALVGAALVGLTAVGRRQRMSNSSPA